jgi:hypothetical protein
MNFAHQRKMTDRIGLNNSSPTEQRQRYKGFVHRLVLIGTFHAPPCVEESLIEFLKE